MKKQLFSGTTRLLILTIYVQKEKKKVIWSYKTQNIYKCTLAKNKKNKTDINVETW